MLSSIPAPSKYEPGGGMVKQIAGAVSHPTALQAPGVHHRLPDLPMRCGGTPEDAAAAPIKSQRLDVIKKKKKIITNPCQALGPFLHLQGTVHPHDLEEMDPAALPGSRAVGDCVF